MKLNTLMTTLFIGFASGIAFIIVQPLFGMATLTSRHAQAYMIYGHYSEHFALILSWLVHISVSVLYAFIANIIFKLKPSVLVSVGQVIILGWVTTLLATPANEIVVKLVTSQQFPELNSLSPLNTEIGPKLWLHFLFFIFVLASLWGIKQYQKKPH